MEDRVTTVRSSRKRCDYHVHFGERSYYVWATKEGGVNTHYLNTNQHPPYKEEMDVLEFLRKKMGSDPNFVSCFE